MDYSKARWVLSPRDSISPWDDPVPLLSKDSTPYHPIFTSHEAAEVVAAAVTSRCAALEMEIHAVAYPTVGDVVAFLKRRHNSQSSYISIDPPLEGEPTLIAVASAIIHFEMANDGG